MAQGKYETMKSAILDTLQGKSLTHTQLTEQIINKLQTSFEGSISGYLETVKADLEARRIIERDTSLQPARYRISQVT